MVLPMCPHIVKYTHGEWLETDAQNMNLENKFLYQCEAASWHHAN